MSVPLLVVRPCPTRIAPRRHARTGSGDGPSTRSTPGDRIAEATVALHGSVGPARTTISAVAERAGIQRATVGPRTGSALPGAGPDDFDAREA
jgi:hypothetical protein